MIYYDNGDIRIRTLEPDDAERIAAEERAQGWGNASADKYNMRLRDMREGRAIALAADFRGEVAGYINVYPDSNGALSVAKAGRKSWISVCLPNSAGTASDRS